MISFELTDEQGLTKSMMEGFAKDVLRPATRRLDTDARMSDDILDALWSLQIIQSHADAGSGVDRSPVTNAILLEELAAGDAVSAAAVASTLAFLQAVANFGTEEQRAALLPDYAGQRFTAAAVALSETSFGFDISALKTRAERTGEGFRLSGVKAMVPLAARCRHFLVIAESDEGHRAFVVPGDAVGVSVREANGTLGLRALELAEVSFENVLVPEAMQVGGADTVQALIDASRAGQTAIMTGLGRGILDYVIPYTKDRVVHGSALAQKQTIAFNIADMHIEVEAMRWMAWKAAWAIDTKTDATRSAQLAFTYAGEKIMKIADDGVQAFGGHGYVREHPIELWYRDARSLSVLEGIAGI